MIVKDWKARYELLERESRGYGEGTTSPLCDIVTAKNIVIRDLRDEVKALKEQIERLNEELRKAKR